MVQPTLTLEMALGDTLLDHNSLPVTDHNDENILDGGLVDRTSHVRTSQPISVEQGIGSNDAQARVADVGSLTALLDNQSDIYTPDGASVEELFKAGMAMRLGLSYGGEENYTRMTARRLTADSGTYGRQATEIVAHDYMLELAKSKPQQIPVQLSKRDDQLLQTVLDYLDNQPLATDFAVGPDTYDRAFQNAVDEHTKALGLCQAIANSGLGYIFVRSDDDGGEELVYQSRITRLSNDTPVATLNDTMEGVVVTRDETRRARKVTVYVNPVRVDTVATTVLYSSERELVFAPGETKTFTAYYRDPSSEDTRVAGVEMVTPLISTDYKFSSTSGSGEDLNAQLGVSVTFGGNSALVTMTNNAGVTGYLWHRQLRGKGIYIYGRDSRFAENADQTVGVELEFLLPYNDSLDQAQDFANVLLEWWGSDASTVDGVYFNACHSANNMDAFLKGNIGALVTLTEAKTNLSGNFYIQHRKFDVIQGGASIPVVWTVVPASFASFCILDSATNAQLDSTAILAV